jgi:competence protein ComEC
VRVPALLRRPSRYLNPGVPDEERAMARRGVVLVGSVKSGALVDVLSRGSPLEEVAAVIRARTRTSIRETVGRFSRRSAGIVTAIIIGDRSGLDPAVQTRLQEAGTYHVIAISGGNIAILAGVTLTLFRWCGVLGRGAMLITVAWLLAYGYLVGGSASVDRATLMAVIYLLGRSIDLGGSSLNVLALVAGVLALRDPLVVADPGFLLTFGATASILVAASLPRSVRLPWWLTSVVALFCASLSAEVALLPVGASFFSRVTLAGLVLNFAAIPLMAVAQLAGMLVVPLYELAVPVARVAGYVSHLGAEGLVRSAELVRFAPIVTWRVVPPPAALIGLYYVSAISAWTMWRSSTAWTQRMRAPAFLIRRFLTSLAIACGMAIVLPVRQWRTAAGDGALHVTFIDVGQGDAALVRFPGGATMQVDAGGLSGGGTFDIGERIVAPVLRQAGVGRLGTLLLTHGDADHAGGALALVREFRPWEVWEGVPVPPFMPLQVIAEAARASSSRWTLVQPDDRMEIDGVSVVVHHPPRPDWERQDVRNDDSIVAELRWRDVSIILTGDIGSEVEHLIGNRFTPAPLRVLKVPHHGSATSSAETFVRALAPKVAVISVGRSNNYGHPHPDVLARYHAVGAAVFRTDQDGAVNITTDGQTLKLRTFTGREMEISNVPRNQEIQDDTASPTPRRTRRARVQ